MKSSNKQTMNVINWIKKNYQRLIVLILVETIALVLLQLPYINILGTYFAFIPYTVLVITIELLFKPKKEIYIITALGFFGFNYLFTFTRITKITDILGNISYFCILMYVILSLIELQQKKAQQ